jgi:hypothetical protein
MGMFENSYVDLPPMEQASGFGDTNAFMIGAQAGTQGMFSSLGKLAGFKDEEDLMQEIYDTADFTTMEGRQAAVAAVMKINPEQGKELQIQLNQAAQAEQATQSMEQDTQDKKVKNMIVMKGSLYANKFKNDASPEGMGYAIHEYLTTNEIDFVPADIKTVAQARALITKLYSKDKDQAKEFRNGLTTHVGDAETRFIQKSAYIDAGVTQQVDSGEVNNFDIEIPKSSSATSTTIPVDNSNLSPDFNFKAPDGTIHTNPETAPQGEPFRGKKNGVMGTWTYNYIGGGYEEGFGVWRHRPDAAPTAYSGEDTIVYNGQTASELDALYNNFM